ncbi:hypothetical protein pdam_00000988, partial [Pocillopora damicornis]
MAGLCTKSEMFGKSCGAKGQVSGVPYDIQEPIQFTQGSDYGSALSRSMSLTPSSVLVWQSWRDLSRNVAGLGSQGINISDRSQYQSLQMVGEKVRRITHEILGVKGLRHMLKKCAISLYKDEKGMPFMNFKI